MALKQDEYKIIVSALDKTSPAFASAMASMEKLGKSSTGTIETIKKHWLGITAAITGAIITINKAWNLAEQSAAFEEQKASLNALAGQYNTTANAIISDIKKASQGLIAMDDAARIAGTALMKNLKPDQIINLAEAAETLSNVTGEKVPQAFENLVGAIALGRERALEASVGIIDLNAKFGDQVNKMTDTEKAATRYEMVMEKVKEIQSTLGPSVDSTADKMDRLKVTLHELQLTLGTGFIRAFSGMMSAIKVYSAGFSLIYADTLKTISALGWLTDKLGITENAYKNFGDKASESYKKADEAWKKAIEYAEVMVAGSEELQKAMQPIKDMADEALRAAKEIENLNKHIQDLIDKDIMTPIELIKKQVEEWKRLGADRLLVEKWVQAETAKLAIEGFEDTKKKTEDALKLEEDSAKTRIDILGQWRDYYMQTYDSIIAKAKEYYAGVMSMDEILRHGREWLEGLGKKPLSLEEEMEKDKKAIQGMLKEEGFNVWNYEQTKDTMSAISTFIDKYKGMKSPFGFEIDFSGIKREYELLLNKVDMMRQNGIAATNEWNDFANKTISAIQSVNDWVIYLQNRIQELDVQISNIREIKIDISSALNSMQILTDYVNAFNDLIAETKANIASKIPTEGMFKGSLGIPEGTKLSVTMKIPTAQHGITYVPSTGPYLLHQGERVVSASQNTSNITFAPIVNNYFSGIKDADDVIKTIDVKLCDAWRTGRLRLKRVMLNGTC